MEELQIVKTPIVIADAGSQSNDSIQKNIQTVEQINNIKKRMQVLQKYNLTS